MIDPMLKISLACLANRRQETIALLQKLGTVHVVPMQAPASASIDTLRKERQQVSSVQLALENLRTAAKGKNSSSSESLPTHQYQESNALTAPQILQKYQSLQEQLQKCGETLLTAEKALEQLAPWGSFDKEKFTDLLQHGLHAYPCLLSTSNYQECTLGEARPIVTQTKSQVYFLLLSRTPLDETRLPLAPLPQETHLPFWKEKANQAKAQQQALQIELNQLAMNSGKILSDYSENLEKEWNFAQARDGMEMNARLAFLQGYLPADQLNQLRQAAKDNGWALRYEEVAEDDEEAPTNLKLPKALQMAKCIFDFVGILPGYHEQDVSVCIMIFLSIFCGMLVGDAAYGLLFTLISLFGLWKAKSPEAKKGLKLLTIMSLCILGYGALSGTWFGIPSEVLPRFMRGIPWLTSGNKDAHIQLVCFFLGAFQMSLACAWQMLLSLKKLSLKDNRSAFIGKIRGALGQVGWGLFLWANFGLAKLLIIDGKGLEALPRLYSYLFLIGFVDILVCAIDWTNMGDIIYMPFTFINCFVDVLSYIRLFAVGLSSFYIASCFNSMAMGVWNLSPWCIPFALLIMALGHLLNIALAAMGVLVHGIRLNTLEFSGHMNLSWSGKPYNPLK